jgi:hypothetical protein
MDENPKQMDKPKREKMITLHFMVPEDWDDDKIHEFGCQIEDEQFDTDDVQFVRGGDKSLPDSYFQRFAGAAKESPGNRPPNQKPKRPNVYSGTAPKRPIKRQEGHS